MTPTSRSDARGQTLTEFALVIPVLIILVMALFDFGRAMFYLNSVSEAARNGSRIAIVNQHPDYICQTVAEGATALGLPTGCVDAAVSPGVTHLPESGCAGIDCQQTVLVKVRFEPIMPVLGGFIGPIDLSSESTVHVERVCQSSDGSICPSAP